MVAVLEAVEILETLLNMVERVRKFHTDICWICGKGRHQKGQECKALEAVCRNCYMKAKHSTYSVDIPGTSNNSTGEPSYYNEHRDLIYPHMVNVHDNKHKHLIQFPTSTELGKVRNSVESSKCPTVLLKVDTGADVNLMNSKTFDSLFGKYWN